MDAVFCRSCRRALNVRLVDGQVGFLHAEELRGGTCDHRADPVPLTELSSAVLECDAVAARGGVRPARCAGAGRHRDGAAHRVPDFDAETSIDRFGSP